MTPRPIAASNEFNAITLEVMRNALAAVAEEMGAVLKLTAFSPNIKERLDASCAIFDSEARLVAQAEHVPVHLGSMMSAVGSILKSVGHLDPDDVVIANDPFVAGAHLPDITLLSAIYADDRIIGYVATRAHHSDVGGMEPGSMPGQSTSIFQEGITIPAIKLYRRGELQQDIERLILGNVRTPEERRGDFKAQLAALRVGGRRIIELANRYGSSELERGFNAILLYSERRMLKRLAELPHGIYEAEDQLDGDGTSDEPVKICVKVTVSASSLEIDFTGSSPQRPGNINAVEPMTRSAVFFAVKLLTDPTMPANAGVLKPLNVIIPKGTFLNAQSPAAVCAGNTETTQRVADTLLKAFSKIAPDRIPAAGQGTMNLISVGGVDPRNGRSYTYVETVCGGQGGRPHGPGMDGVQVNMTNTLNTPVEALEMSYPLQVENYELRENTGGEGLHRGGCGVTRSIRVIGHSARVSIQSDRRVSAPYGLHGGEEGTRGNDHLSRANGSTEKVASKGSFTLNSGDKITVQTPGGGGWGRKAV